MVEVNLSTFQVTQAIGGRMRHAQRLHRLSDRGPVSPDQRFYDHLPGDLPFERRLRASKAACEPD
jgi:hypothetical protein